MLGACLPRVGSSLASRPRGGAGRGRSLRGRGRPGLTPVGRPFAGRGQVGEEPAGGGAPVGSPLAARLRAGAAPAARSHLGSRSPWSPRSGLISAGSWWPVRARAPRPNSMAIVRRPLCSGGGHFLRGWAGAGGRKRSELRPRRRGRPGPWAGGSEPDQGQGWSRLSPFLWVSMCPSAG